MKKTSTFRELMKDPNKKYDETAHALARLFRDILASRGLELSEWEKLTERYYRKIYTNRHGVVDLIKVNQEKSNLTRALAKDSLPWFRFETAIQILGPKMYSFTAVLDNGDGHVYKHTVKIPNRYAILPPDSKHDGDDVDPDDKPERKSLRAKLAEKNKDRK